MLTYLNNTTREVLNVVRTEVDKNLVLYHYLDSNGNIGTLNQMQVITVRYYHVS